MRSLRYLTTLPREISHSTLPTDPAGVRGPLRFPLWPLRSGCQIRRRAPRWIIPLVDRKLAVFRITHL